MVTARLALTVLLAVCSAALTSATQGRLEEKETFAILDPVVCEGTVDKGEFVSLRADNCDEGQDFCEKYSQFPTDYTLVFVPGVATTSLSVMATAKNNLTGKSELVSYWYKEGILLGANTPVILVQSLVLPSVFNETDPISMDVQWIIQSKDGGVEMCREFRFEVMDWNSTIPLEGSSVGENCTFEYQGVACNFSNSVCTEEGTCACSASAIENQGFCETQVSGWCKTNADCGANGVCNPQTDEAGVCSCSNTAFEYMGKCTKNTGAVDGASCLRYPYPCGFDKSICLSDLTCSCDASSYWNATSRVCVSRLGNACATVSECGPNADCVDGSTGKICECPMGYAPNLGQCEALNGGQNPGEPCLEPNYKCNFADSLCYANENGEYFCNCALGFIHQGGCKRVVGSECSSDFNCVDGAECVVQNNLTATCECRSGFMENERACKQLTGQKVGDSCGLSNVPCAFPLSVCSEDGYSCSCAPGAIEQYSVCRIPRGGVCSTDFDCVTFATCQNEKCVCDSGRKEVDDGRCAGCGVALYAPLLLLAVVVKYFN